MLFEYIKRHQKGFGNQKTKSILSDIYNELKNDHHNVELIDAIKNLETNFTALMAEKGKKEMDKSSVKTFDVHGGIAKRRGESSAQKEEDQPNDQSIEAELMRIVDGMDKEMTSHDLQIKNFQQLLHKVIEKIKEDVHEPDISKIKKIRKELSKDQRFREIYLKGQLVRVIMESSPEILSKFLDEKKVIVYQIALANAYKNRGGRRRVVHLPETVMEAIQDMVFAHVKQEQWFKDEIKVKDILKKHTVEQLSQENQEVSTAMDKLEKNFSDWMDANAEKGVKESAGKRKLPQTPEIDTYNSFDIKDQKDADAPPQPSKRRRESATGEISSSTHKKLFYGTQGLEEDH